MLRNNGHAHHVAARLLDFFDTVIPWPRRLWSVGVILSAQEVLETTDAVAEGLLSDAALDSLCKATFEVAVRDRGLDPSHLEPLKQLLLKSDIRAGSGPYFTLRVSPSKATGGASPQPDESWTGGTAARGVNRGCVLDRGGI
ncbi:MAG: hypothetical protein ACRD0K_23430, partial [Egibacteraceae bacterium]